MSSKYVSKPVAFNFFFPMDLKISPIIYISFTCIPQGPRHHGNCRGDWEKISHLRLIQPVTQAVVFHEMPDSLTCKHIFSEGSVAFSPLLTSGSQTHQLIGFPSYTYKRGNLIH